MAKEKQKGIDALCIDAFRQPPYVGSVVAVHARLYRVAGSDSAREVFADFPYGSDPGKHRRYPPDA